MPGQLIIVATPIGNLEDLSPRAARALTEADLVASEDTRRTGRLLAHLGLKRPLISLHEHNERQRLPHLLAWLREGHRIALVSDAGTPLLSDPGYLLVREAIREDIEVDAIPGPSAVIDALVLSGLPPHPYTFGGFPPPKTGKRRRFFERFRALEHTLVFFESPHRLLASLADLQETLGNRSVAVCRELTKLHQEVLRGDLQQVRAALERRSALKGEFTLVVGAAE
jgi:16S rRNA (cytidine1402-2'-O)-methyltransferase